MVSVIGFDDGVFADGECGCVWELREAFDAFGCRCIDIEVEFVNGLAVELVENGLRQFINIECKLMKGDAFVLY